MISVGQTFETTFSYSQQDVEAFAKITGDHNPIHLDAEYAAQTPFKKPIIHGFLGGSIFSKILGTQFPGEGSIYLMQSMDFKRPMYVEETYKAVLTVKEIDEAKNKATIETKVLDANTNKLIITGEAVVMHKEKIK
jgi:acyl dehydratase